MPKFAQKALTFPLAGVSRSRGYREQTRPYAAPWAVNVRGVCPLERRERGGSRPGLVNVYANPFENVTAVAPVTYVDANGTRREDLIVVADGSMWVLRSGSLQTVTAELHTDAGVSIETDDGDAIVFNSSVGSAGRVGWAGAGVYSVAERFGKLLIADEELREYDPLTGMATTVAATAGTVPAGCPLVALYRGRVFLGGTDHVWYASRQDDAGDWNFGADSEDVGRAVAGQVGGAGRIGEKITAMIPFNDSIMVMATANGLWHLRGDPTTGTLTQYSRDIGIISPTAWAQSPSGVVAFLSNDGIYLMGVGSNEYPSRFSQERVPDELRNVDSNSNVVALAYDVLARGFHLSITPSTGTGTHWFLDLDNKALWPVRFNEDHQPVAMAKVQGTSGNMAEIVMACRDGYLRKYSADATTDDGESIESHVLIGPFRLAPDDLTDAMLTELHGIMADNAGAVQWRLVMGSSAEAAADTAVEGIAAVLAGPDPAGVAAEGTWTGLRNRVARPRSRGPWAVVWLSSATRWAYEAVAVGILQLGRLR